MAYKLIKICYKSFPQDLNTVKRKLLIVQSCYKGPKSRDDLGDALGDDLGELHFIFSVVYDVVIFIFLGLVFF